MNTPPAPPTAPEPERSQDPQETAPTAEQRLRLRPQAHRCNMPGCPKIVSANKGMCWQHFQEVVQAQQRKLAAEAKLKALETMTVGPETRENPVPAMLPTTPMSVDSKTMEDPRDL